jgi:hypothetical protein
MKMRMPQADKSSGMPFYLFSYLQNKSQSVGVIVSENVSVRESVIKWVSE